VPPNISLLIDITCSGFPFHNLIDLSPGAAYYQSSRQPSVYQNSSPFCTSTLSLHADNPNTQGKSSRWLANFKFSKVKLKFSLEREVHSITKSRKFLYGNKTINLSTQTPDWISKHPVLTISFEAATSGRDAGKSELIEGQKSFHTAVGSADSANVRITDDNSFPHPYHNKGAYYKHKHTHTHTHKFIKNSAIVWHSLCQPQSYWSAQTSHYLNTNKYQPPYSQRQIRAYEEQNMNFATRAKVSGRSIKWG